MKVVCSVIKEPERQVKPAKNICPYLVSQFLPQKTEMAIFLEHIIFTAVSQIQ